MGRNEFETFFEDGNPKCVFVSVSGSIGLIEQGFWKGILYEK